ncbi:Glycine-rich RNA-binding protein 4, mitochondrial [Morella rubra]|uniref:Glycine-rich RNA-binding protein 4, mitochondrial n=1 Tax=Morella rubra TaxID=262757 RepID=A0A6A1WJT2_9ROSI|nr:Glycine-rich RNA-binding protein 4, mitochondrial [Morella rubra]
MEKPGVGVVTKAQMVDCYAQALSKVLGNIYAVSMLRKTTSECAGVPGVLSVLPDKNFDSENKDYGANLEEHHSVSSPPVITFSGLSFYTSEKTLRAAFEGYGELVEVKIIMDKISKRSKGYAFIEYTTEEAASAALKEMNGKIINGWMIVVDVARSNPPRYSRPI